MKQKRNTTEEIILILCEADQSWGLNHYRTKHTEPVAVELKASLHETQ